MKKIEKLISIARKQADRKLKVSKKEVFERMTKEQLEELAYGDLTEERIREIFDSVGGLYLLE